MPHFDGVKLQERGFGLKNKVASLVFFSHLSPCQTMPSFSQQQRGGEGGREAQKHDATISEGLFGTASDT